MHNPVSRRDLFFLGGIVAMPLWLVPFLVWRALRMMRRA